jgi:hypothetical protein
VCLAVEDWDLLNSYWLANISWPPPLPVLMYEEGGLIMFSFLFEFTYGISIASDYFYFCGGGGECYGSL